MFFQTDGEESVANLDRIRQADGSTPTSQLRLQMQKVSCKKISVSYLKKIINK